MAFWDRLFTRNMGRSSRKNQRSAWIQDGVWQHHDMVGDGDASTRNSQHSNADMLHLSTAVFAAVRRRSRAMARPVISVVQDLPDGTVVPQFNHPALRAFQRVNESLTASQGRGLIETHLLTTGKSFWVKRRNGLGQVVEFEVWDPRKVVVKPDCEKSWVPVQFKYYTDVGTVETVSAEDMVYLRYLVDPRDPLNGVGPITAARLSVDTGLEAMRYNQVFFDNDARPQGIFTVKEGGPAEVARVTDELHRKFRGTDRSHRYMVTEGDLELVATGISQKDMEFMRQMHWSVEEVARAFEMSPVILGDLEHGSFENVEQAMRDFWTVMEDETILLMEQFTEFLLQPDFGPDLRFVADFSNIPFLQPDKKLRAETDEINLRSGKVVINELRKRDGEEDVGWGDSPIMQSTMVPLLTGPPQPSGGVRHVSATLDQGDLNRGLAEQRQSERRLDRTFGGILREELKNLLAYLDDNAEMRALNPDVMGGYVWDWSAYGEDIGGDLSSLYEASLRSTGYIFNEQTSAQTLQEVAAQYARQRGADMLVVEGNENIVSFTRERVRRLTSDLIENGGTLRELKNTLRGDFAYSAGRASTIARTEIALASGHAQIKSFESQGTTEKEWRWPGGEPDGICDLNHGAVVNINEMFPSGHSTIPGHPNCRCTLLPVRKVLK